MATDQIETHFPIIISGGGVSGLTLALSLASKGIKCAVIERHAPPHMTSDEMDGRNSALSYHTASLLKTLGLWTWLEEKAQPILDILVSDGTVKGGASSLFLHFDHQEIGDQPLGYFVYNQDFRYALWERVKDFSDYITIYTETTISRWDRNLAHISVGLSNGARLTGDLMVVCEGKSSELRAEAGFKSVGWAYGQKGIVTMVEHERPHHGMAQEYFLPHGPFAILPMKGNRSSIVWTEKNADADALLSCNPLLFHDALHERFGDWLGSIRQVGKIWSYPLSFHLCPNPVQERLVLIADAAHGIHPISGQGFNLGMRDIVALTKTIENALYAGMDIGTLPVLEDYAAQRRFDTLALGCITDSLNRLFSNDFRPVQIARRLGLGMVQRIPPLRRFFMRQAAGF